MLFKFRAIREARVFNTYAPRIVGIRIQVLNKVFTFKTKG